ncbi:hypothetical protein I302_103496 [Kwoniella bestiolae CBS 10118]|uniref:Uncharacterized protein n=1 Tax=Kwoniella bestiolae CBS 10118 TaxID=1296100 RepID=A0A1B9G8K4_9TREE|nr:hypothetical protein I302_02198 [Kwoniella bestiolae CBS 10118]OCF27357.1 hypothetical protein I302_02198 [Kwoniella bestiolae CBS 10118]
MSEQSGNRSEPDSGTETDIETKNITETSSAPLPLELTTFPASTLFLDAEGQHWFGQIPPPPLPPSPQFQSAWASNHPSKTLSGTSRYRSDAETYASRKYIPKPFEYSCHYCGSTSGIPRPSLSLFEVKKPWKVKSISGISADTVGKVFRCVYTETPTAKQQERAFTGLV